MKHAELIDVAANAQFDRMTSLLRDVVRSGGRDRWSHLFTHGHKFPTVQKAIRDGYLVYAGLVFEITESGNRWLSDLDDEKLRRQA